MNSTARGSFQQFAEGWRRQPAMGASLELFLERHATQLEVRLASALLQAGNLVLTSRSMPRVLAYGAGADSFAVLLDAIARGEKPDQVVFCDVADSTPTRKNKDVGEWEGTYRHIREIVMPLCRREQIEFEWLDTKRYPIRPGPGQARSLFAWMRQRKQIPVASKKNRICTIVAKVERFERWLTDRYPGRDVEVWVGFEAGEEDRAESDPNAGTRRKRKPGEARRHNRYPLMERNMCRCRAVELILSLGYPVPRKSACQFCPLGSMTDWKNFARQTPKFFGDVVQMEADKPPTRSGKKLSIMAFRTLKDKEGNPIGYKAKMLPEYVQGTPRPRLEPCLICGAAIKATKETQCDWLHEIDPRQRPASGRVAP